MSGTGKEAAASSRRARISGSQSRTRPRGEIHLRLGAYAESVDDFNHALNLKADLYPAVEGRAEASLALDRLDDTKTGYMDLSGHAPPLADKLLQAMQQWLKAHRQDPRGIGAVQLDGLDKWLQERAVAVAKAAP